MDKSQSSVGIIIKTTREKKMKKLLSISLILVTIICLFGGCNSILNIGGGVSDEIYIGAAKQIISKSLKNPSSLTVNDAYIYEKDEYGSAIVYLDITSQNGFGGADRDKVYVCVMYVESDGKYQFHPTWNYTENITNLDYLKSINGFGEPKQ